MDESQLLEKVAPELGLHIRYWHVMDSGKDSVDLLKLTVGSLASSVLRLCGRAEASCAGSRFDVHQERLASSSER